MKIGELVTFWINKNPSKEYLERLFDGGRGWFKMWKEGLHRPKREINQGEVVKVNPRTFLVRVGDRVIKRKIKRDLVRE